MFRSSAPTHPRRRRRSLAAPVALTMLVGLAACTGGGQPAATTADPNESVTLRMSTWGNDSRTAMTEEAIDLFEAAHPHITVTLENAQFSAYWDRLATQAAAGDAPDVIQLDEMNFGAYAGRGALADVAAYSDTLLLEDMSDAARATGQYDGTQFGVPMGLTTLAIAVNPSLFEKAGVAMPDDATWTWSDYQALGAELTQNLDEGDYGIYGMGLTSAELTLWARQHGEEVFPTQGQTALSEATVTAYFDQAKALIDVGAAPPVTLQVESTSGPLDGTLLATNHAAMGPGYSSQVASYSRAAGVDLQLLRAPAVEPGQHHMANAASQWTINAASEHPVEAAQLIGFIVGDPEAARILTTERGIPALASIRTEIEPLVDSAAKVSLDFASEVDGELVAPSPAPPATASSFNSDFGLIASEVMFDRMTSAEGAQRLIQTIAGYGG